MLELLKARIRVLRDDTGATMVEYGLLIVLIALVAAAGAWLVGDQLLTLFTGIDACLTDPGANAGNC